MTRAFVFALTCLAGVYILYEGLLRARTVLQPYFEGKTQVVPVTDLYGLLTYILFALICFVVAWLALKTKH